jgi:hypothetical protein
LHDWEVDEAQRRALGLDGKALSGHAIVRLLLRLAPGDRPAVLEPHGAPWQAAAEYSDKLKALVPWPETPASCRSRLSAMNCEAACERKVASMAQAPSGGFYADPALDTMAPAQRLPACLRSCLSQKGAAEVSLQQRFDNIAERQQQAWRWVEQMTGRPAAQWQAR